MPQTNKQNVSATSAVDMQLIKTPKAERRGRKEYRLTASMRSMLQRIAPYMAADAT
jgi:hypothetical protein